MKLQKLKSKSKIILSGLKNDIDKKWGKFRLRQMRNLHQDQRCFIMGNGPSLNKMDLSLFTNEIVWGSNRCYLLYDQITWRPRFYTAVDTRVVPDIANDINQLVATDTNTTYFFSEHHKNIIRNRKNIYWFDILSADELDLPFGVFSQDPSIGIPSYIATVTVVMLQLAVYLGFNPIYLIGCDTSYVVPKSVNQDGPDGLISTADDDPNHFTSAYFGKDAKWHKPHVERMHWHYAQAKRACDELGVDVFNATIGGELEAFLRVNYLDLF